MSDFTRYDPGGEVPQRRLPILARAGPARPCEPSACARTGSPCSSRSWAAASTLHDRDVLSPASMSSLFFFFSESGYRYCPSAAHGPGSALALSAPSCPEQLAAVHLLGVNPLQNGR